MCGMFSLFRSVDFHLFSHFRCRCRHRRPLEEEFQSFSRLRKQEREHMIGTRFDLIDFRQLQ